MESINIINKYYTKGTKLYKILVVHSKAVRDKAVELALLHPEYKMDIQFIKEAAMLHDIGIFLTNAHGIECYGNNPYICHGYLGAELLRKEGYPKHALVCERHTGTGLTKEMVEEFNVGLPIKDMLPLSMEEKVICYADKFFSKTKLDKEKTLEEVEKSLSRYGKDTMDNFKKLKTLFD